MRFNTPSKPRRKLTMDEEFDRYYPLYLKALAKEKNGNTEGALRGYIYILQEYLPAGMSYYVRPAVILERKGNYVLAIEICNQAIKVTNSRLPVNFDKEELTHRVDRLKKKLTFPLRISTTFDVSQ